MRALGLLLVLLLAGCGVPQDSAPRMLDSAEAPFALPGSSPPPTADDQSSTFVTGEPLELYFVRDGRLAPALRPTTRTQSMPALLEALLGGPTTDELESGLTSVIPATLNIEDVAVENQTAVVELGGPQEQVTSAQPLAFAQIVTTLTASPRVDGVRFRLDGADLSVPRGDGLLSAAPLTRADYRELLGDAPA